MKNLFIYGLAAVGLLASCSNDEVIEQLQEPQSAIGFDGAFVNNTTRATSDDLLGESIYNGGFSVYGSMFNPNDESSAVAPIFANQAVTYNIASSKWTYSPVRYWTPGNNYSFTAFAPSTDANWTYNDNANSANYLAPHGVVMFSNKDGNQDFGFAFKNKKEASTTESPVSFSFDHLLSKINIKFHNTFESHKATLIVRDLQVTSADGGSFDLTQLGANFTNTDLQNSKWTFDGYNANGLTVDYTFADNSGVSQSESPSFNNAVAVTTDNFFFLMPSQESINVSFEVELFSNGVSNGKWAHSVSVPLSQESSFVFKPGCSYTLVAEINAENVADNPLTPIEFTATVNNWNQDESETIPAKN